MISFRYHVVTVVAVFLALAVGVVLGAGPLRADAEDTSSHQSLSQGERADLQARVRALQQTDAFTDGFASTVAPGVLGSSLRGEAVTLVVLPSAASSDVTGLKNLVGVAGGTVAGTVQVGDKLLDAGSKQLVDELGSQLEDRAKGVSVPAGAGPYERIGALLARAVGSRVKGGEPVDDTATSILSGLRTTKLVATQGTLSRRGDLLLFVAGAGQGDAAARRGTAAIVTSLVQAVDSDSRGVVLAGPVSAAGGDGVVKAVRDDAPVARRVSTVDALDRTAGKVVSVLALAGQAAGKAGQYGAADAADGAMPGAK